MIVMVMVMTMMIVILVRGDHRSCAEASKLSTPLSVPVYGGLPQSRSEHASTKGKVFLQQGS